MEEDQEKEDRDSPETAPSAEFHKQTALERLVYTIPLSLLAGAMVFLHYGSFESALLTILGFFVLMAVVAAVLSRSHRDAVVRIFPDRIEYKTDESTMAIAWQDVDSLTADRTKTEINGVSAGTQSRYTLISVDGKTRIEIPPNFADDEQLLATLYEQVGRIVLPRYLRAMEAAETIPLAKGMSLMITGTGMSLGGDTLAWDEIGQMNLAFGLLSLYDLSGKARHTLPIGTIPNGLFFPDLVNAARKLLAMDRKESPPVPPDPAA